MITWWMKLGGNLPPGHDALLFFISGTAGIFYMLIVQSHRHGWTYTNPSGGSRIVWGGGASWGGGLTIGQYPQPSIIWGIRRPEFRVGVGAGALMTGQSLEGADMTWYRQVIVSDRMRRSSEYHVT